MDVVAHALNSFIWEAEAGMWVFVGLVYKVNPRIATAVTQRNLVSENKTKQKKQKPTKQTNNKRISGNSDSETAWFAKHRPLCLSRTGEMIAN